jgi:hypothetical protein
VGEREVKLRLDIERGIDSPCSILPGRCRADGCRESGCFRRYGAGAQLGSRKESIIINEKRHNASLLVLFAVRSRGDLLLAEVLFIVGILFMYGK